MPRVAFESSPSTSFCTFSRCSTLRRTVARAGEGRLGILTGRSSGRNHVQRRNGGTRREKNAQSFSASSASSAFNVVLLHKFFRWTFSGPADRRRQGYGGPPKLHAKAEAGHYRRLDLFTRSSDLPLSGGPESPRYINSQSSRLRRVFAPHHGDKSRRINNAIPAHCSFLCSCAHPLAIE